MLKSEINSNLFKKKSNIITKSYELKSKFKKEDYESDTLISHRTPVLFCTDSGLYLKTIKYWSSIPEEDNYKIQFCDLERWVCTNNLLLHLNYISLYLIFNRIQIKQIL